MNFRPDLIFLFVVFLVIPGLITHSVFSSLIARKPQKIDIFHFILHSAVVYTILYFYVCVRITLWGSNSFDPHLLLSFVSTSVWDPIKAILVLVVISILWGWLYSKFYMGPVREALINRFGQGVEPPSIFSTILSKKYRPRPSNNVTFWLTARMYDKYIEGTVVNSSVDDDPREVYLTSVVYLDDNRVEIQRLPEDVGVVINLAYCNYVEILERNREEPEA